LGVRRSALGVLCSAFCVGRWALGVVRSAFFILLSFIFISTFDFNYPASRNIRVNGLLDAEPGLARGFEVEPEVDQDYSLIA